MSVRRPLLALLLAVAGLPACSNMPSLNPLDWLPSSSTGPKPAELPVLSNPQGVRVLWTANIGAAETFIFSPALAGDSVYAAARAGTVARLDATSGQARWRISVGKRISGGVGADGTLVVVASDDGEVFALDAQDGSVKWRARVSSEVLAAPKLGEGLVLVRSADSRIFAFGAQDGKRRWVYQRAAASLIVRSPATAYTRPRGPARSRGSTPPPGRRAGGFRLASGYPEASAPTARSWWSPPTTARCWHSMRRTAA